MKVQVFFRFSNWHLVNNQEKGTFQLHFLDSVYIFKKVAFEFRLVALGIVKSDVL